MISFAHFCQALLCFLLIFIQVAMSTGTSHQKTIDSNAKTTYNFSKYHIAVIAPLARDVKSAVDILDERHAPPLEFRKTENDANSYIWGAAQGKDVVIIGLQQGPHIEYLSNLSQDTRDFLPAKTIGLILNTVVEDENWNILRFARDINLTGLDSRPSKTTFDLIDLAARSDASNTQSDTLPVNLTGPDAEEWEKDPASTSFTMNRPISIDNLFGNGARKAVLNFCLSYLGNEASRQTEQKKKLTGGSATAEYCFRLWMYHAEFLAGDPAVDNDVLDFIGNYAPRGFDFTIEHGSPELGVYREEEDGELIARNHYVPLYYASSMGLENLVQLFLANGAKVNEEIGTYGTPLEVAVKRNYTGIVHLLLENGADVNLAKDSAHDSDTALNDAARHGNASLVQLLLDNGADVNFYIQKTMHSTALGVAVQCPSHNSGNSIFLAASRGYRDTISLLLKHGAEVGIDNKSQALGKALVEAASHGFEDSIEQLLAAGADPNIEGESNRGFALTRAASVGSVQMVRGLLDAGADVNGVGFTSVAALTAAAMSHDPKRENRRFCEKEARSELKTSSSSVDQHRTVEILLDAGADVNRVDEYAGTALQAASTHSLDIVKTLLAHGADASILGGQHGSALQAAILNDQADIVHLLFESGAPVKFDKPAGEFYYGSTPFQTAIRRGNATLAQVLLDRGVNFDFEMRLAENQYKLKTAAETGHVEMVQKLIALGASVNRSQSTGHAGYFPSSGPLQAAVAKGHDRAVEALLEAGADPNAHSDELQSALQLASSLGSESIVKLLLAQGADPGVRGGVRDESALVQAARGGNESHARIDTLLLENGADVNFSRVGRGTPLHSLSSSGTHRKEIAEILFEHGADTDGSGGLTMPLLESAASSGNDMLVEMLLDRGVGSGLAGLLPRKGATVADAALIHAARGGHTSTAQLLLDHRGDGDGARVRLGGGCQWCVLGAAVCSKKAETVAFLLSRICNYWSWQDAIVDAFVDAAANYGREDIVDAFLESGFVDISGPEGTKILNRVLEEGNRLQMAKKLRRAGGRVNPIKDGL